MSTPPPTPSWFDDSAIRPPQFPTQPNQLPSGQWSPTGIQQSSGVPVALIIVGGVMAVIFTAIIAIGAIGFLGGAAKTKLSSASSDSSAPDPGFAAALSEITTTTVGSQATTTTTTPIKGGNTNKYPAPISGWVSFTDPGGNFHANMAGNPTETDENGLSVWATPYNDGYITNVSYEALNGANSKSTIAVAVAEVGAEYDVTSTKTGTAYGNSYTEITFQGEASGGVQVYERIRFLAAGDNVYGVGVAGSSASKLSIPFNTLMAGFVPLDGTSSGVTA